MLVYFKEHTIVSYENAGESVMSIFTPLIVIIGIIITFLLLFLFIGFLSEPGEKGHNFVIPGRCSDNACVAHALISNECYIWISSSTVCIDNIKNKTAFVTLVSVTIEKLTLCLIAQIRCL